MTTKPHSVNPPHPASSERVTPPLVTISLDTEIGGWRYDEDGEVHGRGLTIADAIIEQAATQLVKQLKSEVAKAAVAKADTEITSQVRDMVSSVLTEPFRITNTWGGSGDPTTIRQRIAEVVAKELKPAKNGSYNDQPVITEVVEREVRAALTTELSDVIKAARDQVVGAVKANAAALIAKAVKDGLK